MTRWGVVHSTSALGSALNSPRYSPWLVVKALLAVLGRSQVSMPPCQLMSLYSSVEPLVMTREASE
jgi:hypothetical protein